MPPDGRGRPGENTETAAQTPSAPTDQVGTQSNGQARQNHGAAQLSIPRLPDDVDNLGAGLLYAACGWYVLPVLRGSKKPGSVVGSGWQHKSSRDPKVIAAWFAGTDHDIALHCGRSGAIVFDVDHPELVPDVLRRHLLSAPFQSTRPDEPRRGHYVFLQPPGRTIGNSNGRLGKAWGEVRGCNGVIIAQPSHHKDGGRYRWELS